MSDSSCLIKMYLKGLLWHFEVQCIVFLDAGRVVGNIVSAFASELHKITLLRFLTFSIEKIYSYQIS